MIKYIKILAMVLFAVVLFFIDGGSAFRSKTFDVPLLEKLSDQGNIDAMYALASLKKYGVEGLEKDHGEALRLFERACLLRSEDACLEFGWLLIVSDTHNDIDTGIKMLRLMSDYNNKEASFRIAKYYNDVSDEGLAKLYAQRAVSQGYYNHPYLQGIISRSSSAK